MKDNKSKNIETILVITTGLVILYYFTAIKGLLIAAMCIGLIGLFVPFAANWITLFWYKLAHALGYVNSRILLTLIFFLILFPLALLNRVFQKEKDPLQLKKKPSGSYFIKMDKKYIGKNLEKMW